jgi:hypothetical protein
MKIKHYVMYGVGIMAALFVINFILGMTGLTGWLYNPYGQIFGKPSA